MSVEERTAIVRLEGEIVYGGVCDGPRAEAQIARTVEATVQVESLLILLSGEPLRRQ